MRNFSCFPGTTNLEQLLLLQGSCSNVRAVTQRTYLVFSLPFARVGVFKAERVKSDPTILRGDSRRLTFSFTHRTYVTFTLIFLARTSCLHRCFSCVYSTANNKSYQESSWITVIPEKFHDTTIFDTITIVHFSLINEI